MRKRFAAALLSTAACGAFAASASANLLVYEPFNSGAVGDPIAGQAPTTGTGVWAEAGTATSPVHQIASGSLAGGVGSAIGNSGEMLGSDNTQFDRLSLGGTYSANTTLYYSLLLQVSDLTGLTIPNTNLNANNDGIIMFNNTTGSASSHPSNWAGNLVIRQGSTGGTYNLGIRASDTPGGTNAGHTYWTGDITPSTDAHFIVVRYAQDGDPADTGVSGDENALWVDPSALSYGAPEGSVPSPDGSSVGSINKASGGVNNYAASVMIGAGISSGSNPDSLVLDEIRVGTTWNDVTTIPEPASLSLLGLGGIGLLSRRRRRK